MLFRETDLPRRTFCGETWLVVVLHQTTRSSVQGFQFAGAMNPGRAGTRKAGYKEVKYSLCGGGKGKRL